MNEPAEKPFFWQELGLPAPGAHISRDDYDALPPVGFHMEWHDGVVVYPNWNEVTMSPAPSLRHQQIVMHLIRLLLAHIPHGSVFTAPTDVRLGSRTVQPDVFWVAENSACIAHEHYFTGPPDLVAEVLSPGNTENDRVTKFDLYEASGVREYWIINPEENYLEVYSRDDDTYRRVGAFKPGQTFHSPLLDAPISAAALFDA